MKLYKSKCYSSVKNMSDIYRLLSEIENCSNQKHLAERITTLSLILDDGSFFEMLDLEGNIYRWDFSAGIIQTSTAAGTTEESACGSTY